MKEKKHFMNIQLFAESDNDNKVDYEAEYKKILAERDNYKAEAEKQKRMKDQYASENADYKKKAEAQMSEEEKKAREWDEMLKNKKALEDEVARYKLEKECLENGFSTKECETLINSKFSIKEIAQIVKSRVDEAIKSTRAEMTKGGATKALMGNGTASKDTAESDFQKYQNSKKTQTNIVKL